MNLLSNAVKFTPPGGRIEVSTVNDALGVVRLVVTDTGIGIDAQQIGGLFVAFEQMGRRDHGGLGLGLAISRASSRLIRVGSRPPVRASARGRRSRSSWRRLSAATTQSMRGRWHPTHGGPCRRDGFSLSRMHEDSAEMLRLALTSAGHVVEVAPTLGAALRRLDTAWDLVVSDLGLPDGSGLDVARRANAAAHRPARLIALSGYGSEADRQASEAAASTCTW